MIDNERIRKLLEDLTPRDGHRHEAKFLTPEGEELTVRVEQDGFIHPSESDPMRIKVEITSAPARWAEYTFQFGEKENTPVKLERYRNRFQIFPEFECENEYPQKDVEGVFVKLVESKKLSGQSR